jgi:hypothetical protein
MACFNAAIRPTSNRRRCETATFLMSQKRPFMRQTNELENSLKKERF